MADELELDLAAALALIEQESHARRLFGADHGPTGDKPPYCNHEVTPQRFEAFLSHVRTGKGSNGLSLCQLTFPAFIEEAQKLGDAYLPRPNMTVGLGLLKDYLQEYDTEEEAWGAFNRGDGNRSDAKGREYAQQCMSKRDQWRQRLGKEV